MPSYTTVPKVLDLYPRVGSMTSITSSNIAFYIDQAENEVNGYLVNNYDLPFSATPPLVETISTEYSLIKILERFFTQGINSENKWVSERKEYVKNFLNQINSGTIALYTNSLQLIAYQGDDTIYSNTMNYNPTFTMLDETLQQIDPDRLDAELDVLESEAYNPYY